jgi:hypothetical protein
MAASGRHNVIYSVPPVRAALLRRGRNEIELLSDSGQHGIEALEPGPAPALMVRYR